MRKVRIFSARLLFLLAALSLAAAAWQAPGRASPPDAGGSAAEVRLDTIKYPQLAEAVKAQRGKVVVVDVWGTFCAPCKREFPNLVRLHGRYAREGLVCMSVSVDPADNCDKALQFLRARGATFANYLLNEDGAVWQKRWGVDAVPVVFVFDRDGKRAAKFVDSDDPKKAPIYQDVEALVKRLLATR